MNGSENFKIAIGAVATLLLFYGAIGLVLHYLFDVEVRSLLNIFAFTVVIFAIALAGRVFPKINQTIDKGLGYYLLFTAMYFAAVMPGIGYFSASKWVTENGGSQLSIAFFIVSGILWVGLVALVVPAKWQQQFFETLKNLGWLTPLIFVFNYLFVSLVFFGFLSFQLYGSGVDQTLNRDDYVNLFGYHLLDSVPGLNISSTLRLEEPIPGERPLSLGLMILLFKLAVLIPGVGAFVTYWKSQRMPADRN